jgi:hypothetical protein
VTWAADLAEAITATGDIGPAHELGVVADVLDCLEIGVVTLGRAAPRTVEGERPVAPIRLFPFASMNAGSDVRAETDAAYNCLLELAEGGAVEDLPHAEERDEVLPGVDVALHRALDNGEWDRLVVLGESEATGKTVLDWARRSRAQVVRPARDEEVQDRVEVLLRRVQPEVEDIFRNHRRLAVENAVQLAAILEQLGFGAEERAG